MEAKHRLGMAAANFAGNLFIFDNNDVTFSMAFVDLTQAIYPAFLFFGMAKNHTLLVTNLIQMDCLASCFFSGSWCRRSRTPTTIRNSKLNVFFQLYKKKCTKMCTKKTTKYWIIDWWMLVAVIGGACWWGFYCIHGVKHKWKTENVKTTKKSTNPKT